MRNFRPDQKGIRPHYPATFPARGRNKTSQENHNDAVPRNEIAPNWEKLAGSNKPICARGQFARFIGAPKDPPLCLWLEADGGFDIHYGIISMSSGSLLIADVMWKSRKRSTRFFRKEIIAFGMVVWFFWKLFAIFKWKKLFNRKLQSQINDGIRCTRVKKKSNDKYLYGNIYIIFPKER